MKTRRRIVGLDPSTEWVGYTVIEHDLDSGRGLRLLDADFIRAQGTKAFRLAWIHEKATGMFKKFSDERLDVAIERTFVGKNPAMSIVMGEGRGALLAAAGAVRGVRIFDYSPMEAKKSVGGSGAASKYQVAAAVRLILKLDEDLPLDVTDAASIALHHYLLGSRVREE